LTDANTKFDAMKAVIDNDVVDKTTIAKDWQLTFFSSGSDSSNSSGSAASGDAAVDVNATAPSGGNSTPPTAPDDFKLSLYSNEYRIYELEG